MQCSRRLRLSNKRGERRLYYTHEPGVLKELY